MFYARDLEVTVAEGKCLTFLWLDMPLRFRLVNQNRVVCSAIRLNNVESQILLRLRQSEIRRM
jgi:hypothetical protein